MRSAPKPKPVPASVPEWGRPAPTPAPRVRPAIAAFASALLLGVTLWGFTYQLGSFPFLDDPNEGQYAEVAREMIERRDWMSPHLNYVLFLNKPPLSYWAIATSYQLFGISEAAARLPSAIAGWLTVALVLWWGWQTSGVWTGCLAASVLFSMGGFFVESHEVRPDLWLVLSLTGAIASLHFLLDPSRGRWRWHDPALLGWQLATGCGLLAKGMIGVVISGAAIVAACAFNRRWETLLAFFHPRSWWLLAAILLPWHVAMSVKHEGFLWDYVVNQHVLFFFDKKFPRDSEPISLGMFWAAFAMRAYPWTPLLPLAALWALARLRSERAHGEVLLLAASGATLALFSLARSRLEHYSLPALPFLALLLGKFLSEVSSDPNPAWQRALSGLFAFLAFVQLNALWVVPLLLHEEEWLGQTGEFVRLALRVFTLLAIASVFALLLWRRRSRFSALPIVAAFACVLPLFCEGLERMAPSNSVYPLVRAIRPHLQPNTIVVYEAPVEYQTVASLNFYLQRKVEVLGPPDFVPPTYLVPYVNDLFVAREELARWWQERDVIYITDPLTPRSSLEGTLPGPFEVLARDSYRWAVRNRRPTS